MRTRLVLGGLFLSLVLASAVRAEQPQPALEPRISVYVNGSKDIGVFKGWPIILKVGVEHPLTGAEAKARPITLQAEKDWTDQLRVDPVDEENRVHEWKFEKALLAKKTPSIALDDTHGALLSFLVSPKESRRLAPGKYTVTVVLKGAVTAKSVPVKIEILPHPASLPPKGEIARDRLMAMYHALRGDKEKAVKIVEQIRYVQTPGPVQFVQAEPVYAEPQAAPGGSGAADLLGIISSFGYGGEIPSVDSLSDLGTADYLSDAGYGSDE